MNILSHVEMEGNENDDNYAKMWCINYLEKKLQLQVTSTTTA